MNNIQIHQFNQIPVSVVDHNGDGWMTGDDIGTALEYNHPRDSVTNIFERNREELEEYSTTIKLMAVDGKERDIRVYNEEGVMMIAFFSKQPKAAAFRKWAVGVLKAYRNKELTQQSQEIISLQTQLVESLKTQLNQTNLHLQLMSDRAQQAQNISEGMSKLYYDEEAKVQRLKRSRGKVASLERSQIIDQHHQGRTVAQIADWAYRSREMVRRILTDAGVRL
jgi:prophage antirepressor-like protein